MAPCRRSLSFMGYLYIHLHKYANPAIGARLMIRTAILGASGYVGGELLRLIAAHPQLTPAKLFGDSKAGQKLGAVHPHLALAYPDVVVERFGDHSLDGVDLVFAALPHGH